MHNKIISKENKFYKSTEFWVFFGEVVLVGIINIVSFTQLEGVEQAWVVLVLSFIILLLKNTLYFTIKQILNNQKSLLNEIDKNIKLEEVMTSYNSIQPDLIPYAQKLLVKFKNDIENVFVRDKRTGKLEIRKYYDILYSNIENIKPIGKIWACSTLFDNEWDPTDKYEKELMNLFIDADKRKVPTNRMFIFKNDKLLQPDGVVPTDNITDEKFLKKHEDYVTIKNLLPYLINKSTYHLYHYPNTKSFVVEKNEWEQYREFLGDGFCAFEYNDKDKKNIFIRDTSMDKVDDHTLCGEILFDEKKIKRTKEIFTELINSHCIDSLKEYVFKNSNDNAKKFLCENGVLPDTEENRTDSANSFV